MILSSQRLADISTRRLPNLWQLIATVVMTVCNHPEEIPAIYHYAMQLKLGHPPSDDLYAQVQLQVAKFDQMKAMGVDKTYNPYAAVKGGFEATDKFRETLLKASALCGLPKSINSMMILKDTTPYRLRSAGTPSHRNFIGGPSEYDQVQARGLQFWDTTYGKVSGRVQSQLATSYPDLWNFTISDIYSDLLSYCDVLTHEETSLIVIAALIPQDVNPQLKGHLKGALNNQVSLETIRNTRSLAMDLSRWCGVKWKDDVVGI